MHSRHPLPPKDFTFVILIEIRIVFFPNGHLIWACQLYLLVLSPKEIDYPLTNVSQH